MSKASKSLSPEATRFALPQRKTLDARRAGHRQIDELRARLPWAFPYEGVQCLERLTFGTIPFNRIGPYLRMGVRQFTATVRAIWNLLIGWVSYLFRGQKRSSGVSMEHFDRIYGGKVPAIAATWRQDEVFADQRANGLFPWFLKKVEDLRVTLQQFPVTNKLVADIIHPYTLEELQALGRLFVVDQAILDGISSRPDAAVAAPKELFWVDDRQKLMPIAVQLTQDPTKGPVFTPRDPPNLWLAVKMHCNSANNLTHSFGVHEGQFHFVSETVWMCAMRNLNPQHPLRRVFSPYFHSTLFINSFIREKSADGGNFEIFGSGCKGVREILERFMGTFNFREQLYAVENLKRRGLDALPFCPYRDDMTTMWGVHFTFVQRMVDVFYETDADVVEDYEIQSMTTELSNACKGVPEMKTKHDLAEFWTAVLHNSVTMHSYIALAGKKYFEYVPNIACHLRFPLPKTKNELPADVIENGMPSAKCAWEQIAMINAIDTFPECNRLNNMRTEASMRQYDGLPAVTRQVHLAWQDDLDRADRKMAERNSTTGYVFEFSMPSRCANQVWN